MAYSELTFGGLTVNVTRISPRQVQSTLKYKVGKTLVKVNTPTRDAFDWELRVSGIISEDIDNTRTSLTNLNDVDNHVLVDGIHDGDFIMEPSSLTFLDDQSDTGMVYRFNFTLIQYQQT